MTALHWATKVGNLDVAKLLLENNANANAKDKNEKTPLDLAQKSDTHEAIDQETLKEIIDLLLKK